MKDSEKAKFIVDLVKAKVHFATTEHINHSANLASTQKGYELWEKQREREDVVGAFDHNPYKVEAAREVVKTSLARKMEYEEILDYAIQTFLNKLDKETSNA
jgi:hypothetical protein